MCISSVARCFPTHRRGPPLNGMYAKYKDRVEFVVVYIREAHPIDGHLPMEFGMIEDPITKNGSRSVLDWANRNLPRLGARTRKKLNSAPQPMHWPKSKAMNHRLSMIDVAALVFCFW